MPKGQPRVRGAVLRHVRGRTFDVLDPRKRYLIVTEGKTEEIYFKHFRTSTGPDVVVLDGSDNKRSLVEQTIDIRYKKSVSGNFDTDLDEAWVVLDRDRQPGNPRDRTLFNEALTIAAQAGIEVAYSNDSFELWFLLHYQDLDSDTHRSHIVKKLEEHIGRSYRKDGTCDLYDEILSKRDNAIRRAERMLKSFETTPPEASNPSTTVHLLVQRLVSEDGFRDN